MRLYRRKDFAVERATSLRRLERARFGGSDIQSMPSLQIAASESIIALPGMLYGVQPDCRITNWIEQEQCPGPGFNYLLQV